MKKHLLVLLVPFSAWAVELHPEQECESLKTVLLENLSQYYTDSLNLKSYSNRIISYTNFLRNHNDFPVGGSDYASLENIDSNAAEVYRMSMVISNQTDYLSSVVSNVVCSACPVDSAGDSSCCEDAISLLESISQDTASILTLVDSSSHILEEMADDISRLYALLYTSMGDITNQLSYTGFLIEHGFLSVTNQLEYSNLLLDSGFSFLGTNLSITSSIQYSPNSSYMEKYYRMFLNGRGAKPTITTVYANPYGSTTWGKGIFHDVLSTLIYQGWINSDTGVSLNNYAYAFTQYFSNLSNEVSAIHLDTTNYFSFFRGEIGVRGVLEDWQSEQVSGTYHDFLTNHYLAVVRGDSLSGNQSSKTNWFSRIETLLAALVFTDTTETNTVDTSAGNTERQQLATSYGTANQAAATFSEDFKMTSQSIVTLYQNYFTTFENASMPSHVVLMRLSNSDPSEEVEIAFQSDSLGILVESCRVVTTLCWSSVGIFLLYKFLVWSARCVIVACQFIYRAISSVFKS